MWFAYAIAGCGVNQNIRFMLLARLAGPNLTFILANTMAQKTSLIGPIVWRDMLDASANFLALAFATDSAIGLPFKLSTKCAIECPDHICREDEPR